MVQSCGLVLTVSLIIVLLMKTGLKLTVGLYSCKEVPKVTVVTFTYPMQDSMITLQVLMVVLLTGIKVLLIVF